MSRQGKITAEAKLRIIESYLKGEIGVCQIGQRIGVDESSIRDWISRYRAEGPSAFFPTERNRVYSPELKRAAVEAYLAGKGTQKGICEKYQIRSRTQLRNWIKMYNRHEYFKRQSWGSRMTKVRKTDQEERIRIVKECLESGKDYGSIAQKHAVSYQQMYTRVKKFEEKGEEGLEDRRGQRTHQQEPRMAEEEYKARIAQLEHENYMLRMERDLLKK